ncbi:hypothetical protein ENUP19_0332G0016 [Entamoeba nuttalli]|uniref:Uncharacterized protein n=1 Tax=Entamoeba nuttalli TaxID=412467 RepID=A0ABQ0DWU1_9EUKA
MHDIKEQVDFHLKHDNSLPFDSLVSSYLDSYIEDCYSLLIGGERLAKLLIALRDYTYYNDISLSLVN